MGRLIAQRKNARSRSHVDADDGDEGGAGMFADAYPDFPAEDEPRRNCQDVDRDPMGAKQQEDPMGIDELKGAVGVFAYGNS